MSFLTDAELKAKELSDKAQEGFEGAKNSVEEKMHESQHAKEEAEMAESKLHSDL